MQTWKHPEVKERELNKYNWLVFNKENLSIGENTDIGAFTLLDASHGIEIEEGVKIDNKKGKVTLKKN